MTDDATGDPRELQWGDEDPDDTHEVDDDSTSGDVPDDDSEDSGDPDLCRVSDPTCEACQ